MRRMLKAAYIRDWVTVARLVARGSEWDRVSLRLRRWHAALHRRYGVLAETLIPTWNRLASKELR